MREIKFRALDSNGDMIYGLPYTDGVNDTIYYKDFNNRLCWRREDGANCNKPYKNGTLMQLICVINGKELYEGDIIQCKEGRMQIMYHISGFNLAFNDGTISCPLRDYLINNEVCVLGNIFQNKELLC